MVSPTKAMRSKRRLLSFLLKKIERREKIKINIFEFMKEMYSISLPEHSSENFLTKPEARFVPVIATFQKSRDSWQEEYDFLQNVILRPKIKELKIMKCSIELLTSRETKNRRYIHRFQLAIILKDLKLLKSSVSAREFIGCTLCDFNKPFLCDDGTKVFFKLDTG